MKASSILIGALLLIVGATASGQTSMIAHRSHGGSDETFAVRGADNFGQAPPPYRKVDSVIILNDSTCIEFSNLGVDTTYNGWMGNAPPITRESIQKLYPSIKFIFPDTTHKASGAASNGRHGAVVSGPLMPTLIAALVLPLLGILFRKLRNRARG